MKGQLKEEHDVRAQITVIMRRMKRVLASVPSAVPRGPCDLPRSIKGFCSWGHMSPYLNYLKT